MKTIHCTLVLMAVWLMVGPALVQAQDSGKGSPSEIKRLWNPEQMMSTACNGLARHYNLDDKQKDFTCKFLNERVTKFLDRYAKELSLVLVNLAPFQLTGVLPGAETAKKISDKAYPIFLAAKDTLIKDNNEWRNAILNDEQKKIHDRHLDGLNRQFNLIDRTFKDWRQGKVQSTSPLGGVRLSGGQRVVPEAIAATRRYSLMHESRWGVFVQDFIRLYKLDESQKAEALSILDDLKKQAVAYRKSNAKALSDADNHLSQAKKSRPIDVKAIDAALATMETLNKPIGKWRIDLQTRLSAIPTEKQKSDFAQRSGR